jgi:hypothetical protein
MHQHMNSRVVEGVKGGAGLDQQAQAHGGIISILQGTAVNRRQAYVT